ncbi:hypothetical protein CDAR_383351 [Caerostris darwini]|uniref:Uncharacterized protein n=1 Tax=Caerostris darwini TaxID=1538125 RepID=A0AAV4NZ18_9ARAC|nr:hypothetical protein CDAR_383351 [Caerostris darwini]
MLGIIAFANDGRVSSYHFVGLPPSTSRQSMLGEFLAFPPAYDKSVAGKHECKSELDSYIYDSTQYINQSLVFPTLYVGVRPDLRWQKGRGDRYPREYPLVKAHDI